MVSVRYRDGSVERAPVAVGGRQSGRTGVLSSWTVSTAFEADSAILGRRRRAIDDAIAARALRTVRLEELGCYGSCARYAVTFSSNGSATLLDECSAAVRHMRVRVSFTRVLDAADGLRWLRTVYPRAAVDTQAARITFATRTASFVSYGPDRTTWDVPFAIAENRLDQLVRDLPWRPHGAHACV